MKTLLLLRHAKSSWKDSDLDDHERPLNKRGKREAPRMGQLLQDEGLLPDFILASSARRCRKTAEHVIHTSGYRGQTRITGELYEADAPQLRSVLAALPADVARVLVIAHNPGLEVMLEELTGRDAPLSTAALAHVEVPINGWHQLSFKRQGKLLRVWQPRELD